MSAPPRGPVGPTRVERIVSGGQTGVDRAALDVALEGGIPAGGWCPRGRRAEDGRIPHRYPLQETNSSGYPERTRRNVSGSDATLILTRGPIKGGTALTVRLASRLGRPLLVVDLDHAVADDVRSWIARHGIEVLNVAGPRENEHPGIGRQARTFLAVVLGVMVPTGDVDR
ncbi:MAG: putative molybdenum carrier protein [Acidobacteriota bacterium]